MPAWNFFCNAWPMSRFFAKLRNLLQKTKGEGIDLWFNYSSALLAAVTKGQPDFIPSDRFFQRGTVCQCLLLNDAQWAGLNQPQHAFCKSLGRVMAVVALFYVKQVTKFRSCLLPLSSNFVAIKFFNPVFRIWVAWLDNHNLKLNHCFILKPFNPLQAQKQI